LAQSYIYSDSPLVQTEAQTEQSSFGTVLTASRQMGSRLSAQISLDQSLTSSSGIGGAKANNTQNMDSWVLSGGVYYQTDYRLVVGINASGGYNVISPGSDMEFEQIQGTLSWQPFEKLSVMGSVGVEDTQLLGTQLIDPTFSGSVNYQPYQNTSMSLVGSRSSSASIYQDDVVETTALGATFRQRFLQHFSFEASVGYTLAPFVGFATVDEFANNNPGAPLIATGVQQSRTDYSRYFRVSLGTSFRQHGSVSIFYSYSDLTSTLSPYALTTSQVGFEIGWRY
jgi:hypothetical protein